MDVKYYRFICNAIKPYTFVPNFIGRKFWEFQLKKIWGRDYKTSLNEKVQVGKDQEKAQ